MLYNNNTHCTVGFIRGYWFITSDALNMASSLTTRSFPMGAMPRASSWVQVVMSCVGPTATVWFILRPTPSCSAISQNPGEGLGDCVHLLCSLISAASSWWSNTEVFQKSSHPFFQKEHSPRVSTECTAGVYHTCVLLRSRVYCKGLPQMCTTNVHYSRPKWTELELRTKLFHPTGFREGTVGRGG